MKKFLISFFSILLITLTSVVGGLLLSGCNNSSYSETNGGGNLDNSENEIPSDEDDVSAQYLCYIYLGGTILSPREPDLSNYDSENTSNPPWDSTWGRPYHEQISGCSVNVTGSGIGGNGITLNDSSTTTRARVSTQSTYTIKFTATVGAGYTFAGWWAYSSESEPISWSRVSRSLTWEIRVSDYSYLFSRDSSPENNYICGIFYRNTYTNTYRYRNSSGDTASVNQTRYYNTSFTAYNQSNLTNPYTSNGWSLYGWGTTSTTTTRSYTPGNSYSSTSTSTMYLYAISQRTISLVYNANSGSNAPSTTTSTSIFIGAEPNNSATTPYGQYFKGKIRSVFIYNNSLSKDEILDLKSKDFYSGFGTEEGNYLAVTEKVVFASAWSSTKLSLGDGYTSSTLRTNISDFVSDTQMNIDYTGARSYTIKNFRNVNGASADTTISVDIIVSNESEIESVFGDLSAEFSDLVSDILGNNLMYWTRDVGSNLNTAECITRLGSSTQTIMQKILGVRLTANVSTFGCL